MPIALSMPFTINEALLLKFKTLPGSMVMEPPLRIFIVRFIVRSPSIIKLP